MNDDSQLPPHPTEPHVPVIPLPEQHDAQVADIAPPPLPHAPETGFATGSKRRLTVGVLLVLGGMAALFALSALEFRWLESVPWAQALAGPVAGSPPVDAIPALIRVVPLDNFPEQQQVLEAAEALTWMESGETLKALGYDRTEALMLAPVPTGDMEGMLQSGRLPSPGKPEVLAGDLCRIDSFKVDNITFNVTGRLRPGVGALTFTYLLPEHEAWLPLFQGADDTVEGWILPEGMLDPVGALIDAGLLKEEDSEDKDAIKTAQEALMVYEGSHFHAMTRTHPGLAIACTIVLALMLVGAATIATEMLLLCRVNGPGLLRGLSLQVSTNLRGWYAVHIICYGTFIAAMCAGLADPLGNMQMLDFVRAQFSEGGLAYVGDAYLSGDIIAAANATWVNNYLLQTVLMTIVPSVLPVALGFFKTLVSFGMVGFAMAPGWTDTISGYTFHSGTMVLELEPYVLVAYVVLLWPKWFFQGIFVTRDFGARLARWINLVFEAAVVSGILLYLAAIYEGITLITFSGLGG